MVLGQEIWVSYGSPKGQKNEKNDLIAPILTHRKQSWENALLEGQMDTKLENSTWVGKQTGMAFQQANLSLIWTSESSSNQQQSSAVHIEISAAHIDLLPNFSSFN